ncbi:MULTISPECIES: class I SAM-dependent methyltransferase [Flavobacterium]|uniref:class I SAM-dependent methyltransferase n=1 Tax=Flavobacterium TaxID=237 RepID=UPI001FCC8E80|nr:MULTISPECIES: class I SAM-dependent methyltransferase [Flavobacterium]UOK41246.1 class I SAM-dependent methyltransferase [Flavobacterium enshiense]
MIEQSEILNYLKTKSLNLSLIDKLKVNYRPLICPFDVLLKYVGENESVFDIGCGSGQFCALIAKFSKATTIHGIEISETLVSNAIAINQEFKNEKEVTFEVFDGSTIPIEIKKYSIIYLIDVLHHVPKNKQILFLKEIYSKMDVGSKLILKDINADHPFVYFNKIHDLLFSKEIGNEISLQFAKKTVESIGFKTIEEFSKTTFIYPHYFLILEK